MGLRHRRGKFQSSQNDLMVSHAHKMVQPNQPLLKFTKKKVRAGSGAPCLKIQSTLKNQRGFLPYVSRGY